MIDTAKNQSARPLIAIISSFGGKSYTFNVAYGVGKAGADVSMCLLVIFVWISAACMLLFGCCSLCCI